MYRQGDVLILRVNDIPQGMQKAKGRCVLAHGEVTGHAHEVKETNKVDWYTQAHDQVLEGQEVGNRVPEVDTATWMEVKDLIAEVTHQEHDTISLPQGKYKIIRQREYSPEAIRNVAD